MTILNVGAAQRAVVGELKTFPVASLRTGSQRPIVVKIKGTVNLHNAMMKMHQSIAPIAPLVGLSTALVEDQIPF